MAKIEREFVVLAPLPASVAHRSLVQMLEGRAAMLDRRTAEGASLYTDLMEAADVICKLSANEQAFMSQVDALNAVLVTYNRWDMRLTLVDNVRRVCQAAPPETRECTCGMMAMCDGGGDCPTEDDVVCGNAIAGYDSTEPCMLPAGHDGECEWEDASIEPTHAPSTKFPNTCRACLQAWPCADSTAETLFYGKTFDEWHANPEDRSPLGGIALSGDALADALMGSACLCETAADLGAPDVYGGDRVIAHVHPECPAHGAEDDCSCGQAGCPQCGETPMPGDERFLGYVAADAARMGISVTEYRQMLTKKRNRLTYEQGPQ